MMTGCSSDDCKAQGVDDNGKALICSGSCHTVGNFFTSTPCHLICPEMTRKTAMASEVAMHTNLCCGHK